MRRENNYITILLISSYASPIGQSKLMSKYYTIITTCAFPSVKMPIAFRTVVWTFGETAKSLVPSNWLTRVDLPTLGAPITAAFNRRCSSEGGGGAEERAPGWLVSRESLSTCSCTTSDSTYSRMQFEHSANYTMLVKGSYFISLLILEILKTVFCILQNGFERQSSLRATDKAIRPHDAVDPRGLVEIN